MQKVNIIFKDGSIGELIENKKLKQLKSKDYNFIFDKTDGYFIRCGANAHDDSNLEKSMPEIADIEITTICTGVGTPCKFCYKGNTAKGENMSFETFKKVFAKLPKTITQIAFGIGDIDANPDMIAIFAYCRTHGVIPNVTVNGYKMTAGWYNVLSELCGAVAVSYYDKDSCYNTIKELTDRGMKQINIHFMISEETYEKALDLFSDAKSDPRLAKLNAIVFLSLKKKGRATKGFNRLSEEKFKELSMKALNEGISIGFDSCSASKFLKAVEKSEFYERVKDYIEPCESGVYSSYINVKGEYFPCSFIEGTEDWETGLSVQDSDDFLNDIWWHAKTEDFRNRVINCRDNCIGCPTYDI